MKKLQEFILSGMPIPESDQEDQDIYEKELREGLGGVGGPAGGQIGGECELNKDMKENPDDEFNEAEERERDAVNALRQKDTALWGMNKAEARNELKTLGYSDSRIKSIEQYKEKALNSRFDIRQKMEEYMDEFPGSEEDSRPNADMDDQYQHDGSAFGMDKQDLGDIEQGFDPNNENMEPMQGTIKPYEQGETERLPPSRMATSGAEGYEGSLPHYPIMGGRGETEESPYGENVRTFNPLTGDYQESIDNRGNPQGENDSYERNSNPQTGEQGWKNSLEFNPEYQKKTTHPKFGNENVSPHDIDPKSAERQKHEPDKWRAVEGKNNPPFRPPLKKESLEKLVKRAIEKGYSREQIKEMVSYLRDEKKKPDPVAAQKVKNIVSVTAKKGADDRKAKNKPWEKKNKEDDDSYREDNAIDEPMA